MPQQSEAQRTHGVHGAGINNARHCTQPHIRLAPSGAHLTQELQASSTCNTFHTPHTAAARVCVCAACGRPKSGWQAGRLGRQRQVDQLASRLGSLLTTMTTMMTQCTPTKHKHTSHTPNTHTETDRRESCSCHTLHVACSPTRFLLDADCSAPAECIYLCLKAGEGGEATVAGVTAVWGQGARGCGEGFHGSRQNELTSRRVRGLISSIGLVACGYISVSAAAASLLLSTSFFPPTQRHPVSPHLYANPPCNRFGADTNSGVN